MPNSKTINPELTFNFILDKLSTFNFRHFKLLIIVLLTFNFVLLTNDCFSQSWLWAKSGGGSATDDGTAVCFDSNGNVYMAGWYDAAPAISDSGTFGSLTVPYSGKSQIFVVKYASDGSEVWAKSIGGNDYPVNYAEQPSKIIYDNYSGCIYLSGKYKGPVILGNDTLTGDGFFITKMDINGNYIWAKKLSTVWASGLTTDLTGSIFICGSCSANTIFDTIPVTGNFIAKFNSSGTCIKVNSNFIHSVPGIISIKNNNLYIVGYIDNDTATTDTLTSVFNYSKTAYIAKFGTNLRMKWVRYMTSTNWPSATDICTDSVCNSFIVGRFRTDIDFGLENFTGYNWGDLFIAKYDSNGVFQWAKQGYNTTGGVVPAFCRVLSNGDFYVAGHYDGTDLKLGNFTVSSPYIARYNSSGNCLNVVTVPNNQLEGISVFSDNSFSIIGYFLGTLGIGSYSVTSHGFGDVYVAKHDMITGEEQRMINTNNQLIVYANPNAGKCTITIPTEFTAETKLTLQIFDNKGTLLQQAPVEMMQDKISVNITAEAKGVYTAVLSNGIKSYTGKIIFE